jgi:DNA-binding MarR family transcriptional regulator
MKSVAPHTIKYIKFLKANDILRQSIDFTSIDFIEEKLLQNIIIYWYSGSPITVSETLEAVKEISNSTLHRRLKNLRKTGMISHVADEIDNRIKYVHPTERCIAYFNQISNISSSFMRASVN